MESDGTLRASILHIGQESPRFEKCEQPFGRDQGHSLPAATPPWSDKCEVE